MDVYSFKIRNDFRFITGGTINPMVSSAYTGTQKFTEYHKIYNTNRFDSTNSYAKSTEFNNVDTLKSRRFIKSNQNQFTIGGIILTASTLNPVDTSLISSGNTIIQPQSLFKNISIPINTNFMEMGQEVDISRWTQKEIRKAINPITEGERVKYKSNVYPNTNLKFRFFNKNNNTYDDNNLTSGYESAGFSPNEINVKNSFKKSFFRLYFFDSNDIKNRNLLSTEDLDVFGSNKPEFKLDRIYWFQDDDYFRDNTNDRIIYMEAKFFNAKTGEVVRFFNPPSSQGTPVKMNVLANNNNWRTSKMIILNPSNNNGYYNFKVGTNSGANTNTTITLTQYRLKIQ